MLLGGGEGFGSGLFFHMKCFGFCQTLSCVSVSNALGFCSIILIDFRIVHSWDNLFIFDIYVQSFLYISSLLS